MAQEAAEISEEATVNGESTTSGSGGRYRMVRALLMIAAVVAGGGLLAACSQIEGTTTTASAVQRTTTTEAPAPPAWTDLGPADPVPDPRSGAAMVHDSAGASIILFGGWDVDTDFGDTWSYDLAANTWTDLLPAGDLPPARALHQLVYDTADGKAILFGGTSDAGRYNDTWSYDPASNTWTDLSGATAPSARSVHAMVVDSGSGKIILFGGYDGSSELGDTWAYDPAANIWTDLRPDGRVPSARKAHAMAYDPVSGRVILFGGYDGSSVLNDTWAYDPAANTWTELDPAGSIPTPRANHRAVYDEAAGQVILFGGYDGANELYDTWAYDPATNTWTDLDPLGPPPPAREEHAMVYDSAGKRVIVFGGLDYPADRDLNDTWALGEWTD